MCDSGRECPPSPADPLSLPLLTPLPLVPPSPRTSRLDSDTAEWRVAAWGNSRRLFRGAGGELRLDTEPQQVGVPGGVDVVFREEGGELRLDTEPQQVGAWGCGCHVQGGRRRAEAGY